MTYGIRARRPGALGEFREAVTSLAIKSVDVFIVLTWTISYFTAFELTASLNTKVPYVYARVGVAAPPPILRM